MIGQKEMVITVNMLGYTDEDIKHLLDCKGKRIVKKGGLFNRTFQFTLREALLNAIESVKNTKAVIGTSEEELVELVRWLIKYKNKQPKDGITKEGNDKWFNPIKTRTCDNRFTMKRFTESLFKQGWNFRSDHKVECQTEIEMQRVKEEAEYKATLK